MSDLAVVHRLLSILHDHSMSNDEKLSRVAQDPEATSEDRMEVARRLQADASDALDLATRRIVLDVRLDQLENLAAVYGLIAKWDIVIRRPQASLGNVIKILPPDQAKLIIELLTRAGLTPP